MVKITLIKPLLIALYGFPGSGKSYVARQLSEELKIPHLSADRIRAELFERPAYTHQENKVIDHLMRYMTQEFLNSGVSVIYDANAMRAGQRYALRQLARKCHSAYQLIWIQIDPDTALSRTQKRDRRTSDDKFSMEHTEESFRSYSAGMQNPANEEYLVISGKHTFATQRSAIINRLYHDGLVDASTMQHSVAKPGLVNLVPNPRAGRVDLNRRNIVIS